MFNLHWSYFSFCFQLQQVLITIPLSFWDEQFAVFAHCGWALNELCSLKEGGMFERTFLTFLLLNFKLWTDYTFSHSHLFLWWSPTNCLMSEITKQSHVHSNTTVRICYSVGLDFWKFITITNVSLHAMHIACTPIANPCSQHRLTHEKIQNTEFHGCRAVFEHFFSLNLPIFLPSLANWWKGKFVERKTQKCRAPTCLAIAIADIFLCKIWWFDFSIPIVIADISLQLICTGYSDILYVFLRFWFWFLSILS